MKTKTTIKLTTVDRLVKELTKFKKKWDYSVTVWIPDGSTLCIVGMELDEDGDLRIELEERLEEEEGFFSVDDTLESLKKFDKDAKVYLAGCGLYLNIDLNGNGSIFMENEDDDVVGCHACAFGQYKMEKPQEFLTEAERRELAEKAAKEKRENRIMDYVLGVLMLGAMIWFIYLIYALVAGVGGPLWEKVLYLVACGIVLVVGCCTLYYSKK